ncbi:methoxymalonate biosynthesis protein [Prauserella aidingensis]|uniref:3-hydroxyacyl-CoA dehydrogenase family protein n=1 Tax=Prauserella aidingensis TaxID=387890 RepID=UPI0027E34808|nr:3-hydroxyacyl-CoA dehydrogenase family protein [Prauserella aidingensis]MCP2251343.1 methoxymalonate biosynthesis protein [Prauserella aidingensis]
MTEQSGDHRITVLGAGTMGVGITAVAVGHGVPVTVVDVDQTVLEAARNRIRAELRFARMMDALPEGERGDLVLTTAVDDGADATAVIEAVTESAEVKAEALAGAATVVTPGTPLVSNTSSIPIDELADAVCRPGDVIGTHFMNPPYLIPLVEVIRGRRTDRAVETTLMSLLSAIGRTGRVVGDSPGFVTSRVLHPMINDAIRVVREGTADAETVDALFEGCLGHRTGPLRTADLIGLDNLADSLRVLHQRTGDEGCAPDPLLLDKVEAGLFGRKTGRGFYSYGGDAS